MAKGSCRHLGNGKTPDSKDDAENARNNNKKAAVAPEETDQDAARRKRNRYAIRLKREAETKEKAAR